MSPSDRNTTPLRIGAVNYLNTKPLVCGLAASLPDAELSYELPSQLADKLATDQLDVALAPCIELARHPEWSVISTACIGCLGPVFSVKLLFRKPPSKVRTLALDEGSRTSVVLSQILLAEFAEVRPELLPFPIDASPSNVDADAVLVIGDRAMHPPAAEFRESWDLGERWIELTGLPFVFAMWMARPGLDCAEVELALDSARDRGNASLSEIARRESTAMGLSMSMVYGYLRDNLHFTLGLEQRRGLDEFFGRAASLNLIAPQHETVFDDCPAN